MSEEHSCWQECEIPDCTNRVPTAKAICDAHAPGGREP